MCNLKFTQKHEQNDKCLFYSNQETALNRQFQVYPKVVHEHTGLKLYRIAICAFLNSEGTSLQMQLFAYPSTVKRDWQHLNLNDDVFIAQFRKHLSPVLTSVLLIDWCVDLGSVETHTILNSALQFLSFLSYHVSFSFSIWPALFHYGSRLSLSTLTLFPLHYIIVMTSLPQRCSLNTVKVVLP